MRTDDEGHRYEERMFENGGGGDGRKIAIDSENCRDRGERGGARIPRLYKNTKTFYKPDEILMHRRLPVRGGKGWKVQKARTDDCRE